MAYVNVTRLIPASKYPLKATYAMKPEYITIHNTYNDASAANEVAYMTRNNSAVSYHVAIDDKQAIQAIPFTRNAWHCGDGQGAGNRKSIGIEICYSKSGGQRYYDAEANAVEYTAQLLKQFGWGVEKIRWHRDWSGKLCPHRMIAEGRLDSFKARVQAALKPKLVAHVAPIKKEDVKLYQPTSKAIKDSTEAVLKQLEQGENGLADKWRKQFLDGTLTDSDAIGLVFVAIQRGLLKE